MHRWAILFLLNPKPLLASPARAQVACYEFCWFDRVESRPGGNTAHRTCPKTKDGVESSTWSGLNLYNEIAQMGQDGWSLVGAASSERKGDLVLSFQREIPCKP